MTQILPDKDLQEILKILTEMKHGPYVMKVSAERFNVPNKTPNPNGQYSLCSSCFSVIEQTWDHKDWCELFKEEPLSEWIKKGKNEK